MAQQWHDINDPGLFFKPVSQQKPSASAQEDEPAGGGDAGAEAKLSDPAFVVPDGGPVFNGKVRARVKVQYLKETPRKKVTFSLFSTYKGQTQDMKSAVEGFEKDGVAEAELTLFYNDAYYDEMDANPDATVDYRFKASHPRGQAEVESDNLTMPYKGRQLIVQIKLADASLRSGLDGDACTLFSTDPKKSYHKKVALKDAKNVGNSTCQVAFPALREDLSYSLEIELADDRIKYLLLDNVSFQNMSQAA